MEKRTLEIGDVLQIHPDHKYGGFLLVVTDPKDWGCQGYLLNEYQFEVVRYKNKAYLLVEWKNLEWVGKLYWMSKEPDEELEGSVNENTARPITSDF